MCMRRRGESGGMGGGREGAAVGQDNDPLIKSRATNKIESDRFKNQYLKGTSRGVTSSHQQQRGNKKGREGR